ncbi:MAG: hypothetical protein A3B30_00110 [Candidatus Komeilibacteria bacterium RIFCSPLOWO2_01_FULL_52_15]|uniref:Uncharacterized protein n=2 Tax=Candidatus Komeiliibacteriota TaxID=1817908 RepID=A0A1G2BN86_9BACT|nr:MAG: hypothetical protein A2677_00185 [Candidatus Komeilibacteria bacterium RIFCSPHIGHO2_01_FULL_52_14]OGY90603.1 MAG: hypothetical protein A3B30_00110 [Candidatus Komeilibacteria bacterium RIFCSPLOWO2_01_FULL_52_15]
MKYGELNLGQIEAVVNKLGGMDGVERFLSGETVVKMLDRVFPTWKTIKLGTHKDALALESALKDADFQILDWANDIMGKPAFTLASEETSIDLVTATVAELGFTRSSGYNAICGRIRELGYELCPAEVGPQLRFQYKDQPLGKLLVIAMEAIASSLDAIFDPRAVLNVFYVEHNDGGQGLSTLYGGPGDVFNPDVRFVFVRRKSSTTL